MCFLCVACGCKSYVWNVEPKCPLDILAQVLYHHLHKYDTCAIDILCIQILNPAIQLWETSPDRCTHAYLHIYMFLPFLRTSSGIGTLAIVPEIPVKVSWVDVLHAVNVIGLHSYPTATPSSLHWPEPAVLTVDTHALRSKSSTGWSQSGRPRSSLRSL